MKGNVKKIVAIVIFFAVGLLCFLLNGKYTSFPAAIALFVAGLVLLVKGGDWFVDGATAIAEKFHIPEVIIGATVVSIGTTLPEVMVSASAAMKGLSAMSYGNAIGSIICNVSLIAAITLAIKPAKVERKSLIVPYLFFTMASVVYCYSAYVSKTYSRVIGLILLTIFVIYIIYLCISSVKENSSKKGNGDNKEDNKDSLGDKEKKSPLGLALISLVFGAAIITFGATLLVDNGTIIATVLNVPETVIALVFVALGTSLPELVTAITSLAKGHGALSVGNIIGANLFNLVLVSGLAITIKPFDVPEGKIVMGMNSSLLIDIPLSMMVMLIMGLPALIKGKMYRWQGILLLCLYVSFCVYQFVF